MTSNLTFEGHDAEQVTYNTILRTNVSLSNQIFGKLYDKNGFPIYSISARASTASGAEHVSTGSFDKLNTEVVSNNPDFSSLLTTQSGRIFMLTHFETPLPAEQYLTEVVLDETSCMLSASSLRRVDWSEYGGLWTPCAGSVSPWNTHLGSEEYEPDAKNLDVYDTW